MEVNCFKPVLTKQAPFPSGSFKYLASLENKHWWFCARNQIIVWILKSKAHNVKSFLEVGCGTGYVISGISKAFPAFKLQASEYFEEGLVYARQRVPRCEFRQLDATLMSEVESYDCIGSFDVLEHIDKDQIVLANFNRAIRSGGFLLITVPQHPWLWSSADDYAHHRRRYTYSSLINSLSCAGFKIKYSTSFVSLLMPLMIIQRSSSRQKPYDPSVEFEINSILNKLLRLVMFVEFIMLNAGIRFFAGGSLLVLAQKL